MFILFKDTQQITPIFEQPAAQSLYGFMEKMRSAALNNEHPWSRYATLQQYANVCFWAIRKMEYGFIANQIETLEKKFNRPLRVLDAGCGVVPLNNWLASRGHEVVAFDPLHEDIEFLVRNDLNQFYGTNVKYMTARGEHLPVPTAWFDVVTCVSVLEHTIPGNDQLIMNEFARVIKPDGHLLMTFDVAPTRPMQEGEDEDFQNLRRFGYPFIPEAAQKLIGSLSPFFKVDISEIPGQLYDLTWEDIYTFWSSTQFQDGRELEKREYLAMGLTIQRNQQIHSLTSDEMAGSYRKGQEALMEQLNFFSHHAESRHTVIHDQSQEIARLQLILSEKENVIQNFRTMPGFWADNGPYIPLVSRTLRLIVMIRRMFLSKLGVLTQYPPKPLDLPVAYTQTSTPLANPPTISIVTPSYNQAEFIGRTIQSVLDQGYPNLEYVVQDGKSTDNTMDVIDQYKGKLTHFETRRDNGQAHAINMGFKHTNGEIMAYLNSDDILLPGTLNYVGNYFDQHPEVDAIYSHRIIINEKDQEVGRWIMPPHDNKILYWADYVPQETLFWRRRIWDKAGGSIDETFNFALDWELLLRFQHNGAVIKRVPRFLAAFRIHEAQKTYMHINELGSNEMQRVREKYLGHKVTGKEIAKNIKSYLRLSVIYRMLYRLGIKTK